MKHTDKYGLNLPESTDLVDVSVLNQNFIRLDSLTAETDRKASYLSEIEDTGEIVASTYPQVSELLTLAGNGYLNNRGVFTSNSSYLTYYYTVTEDSDIYVELHFTSTSTFCRVKIYDSDQQPGTDAGPGNFYSTRSSDSGQVSGQFPQTDDTRIHVSAGQVIGICVSFGSIHSNRYFILHTRMVDSEVKLTDTIIQELKDKLHTDRLVHVTYSSEDEAFTITSGRAKYVFSRFTSEDYPSVPFVDTWRWTECYAGGGAIPLWTSGNDSEGPMFVNTSTANNWISGYHGYEQMITGGLTIIADGTVYDDVSTITSFACTALSIIVQSEVYYPSDTSNVAFRRCKRLDFTYSLCKVSNAWTYVGTRDSTIDVITWYGGLFPIHLSQSTFNGYSLDCSPELHNNESYSYNKNMREAYLYGQGYTVRVKINDAYSASGGNVKYTLGVEQKVYLLAIYASSANPYVMELNDTIYSQSEIQIY